MGVSTQTAINLHNKTIKLIRRKMDSKKSWAWTEFDLTIMQETYTFVES